MIQEVELDVLYLLWQDDDHMQKTNNMSKTCSESVKGQAQ